MIFKEGVARMPEVSKERMGEIALLFIEDRLKLEGGIRLDPQKIKNKTTAISEKLHIPGNEVAAVARYLVKRAFSQTMSELSTII